MKKLIISKETFLEMLSGLIASGVTFESRELTGGNIEIIFTGGF